MAKGLGYGGTTLPSKKKKKVNVGNQSNTTAAGHRTPGTTRSSDSQPRTSHGPKNTYQGPQATLGGSGTYKGAAGKLFAANQAAGRGTRAASYVNPRAKTILKKYGGLQGYETFLKNAQAGTTKAPGQIGKPVAWYNLQQGTNRRLGGTGRSNVARGVGVSQNPAGTTSSVPGSQANTYSVNGFFTRHPEVAPSSPKPSNPSISPTAGPGAAYRSVGGDAAGWEKFRMNYYSQHPELFPKYGVDDYRYITPGEPAEGMEYYDMIMWQRYRREGGTLSYNDWKIGRMFMPKNLTPYPWSTEPGTAPQPKYESGGRYRF